MDSYANKCGTIVIDTAIINDSANRSGELNLKLPNWAAGYKNFEFTLSTFDFHNRFEDDAFKKMPEVISHNCSGYIVINKEFRLDFIYILYINKATQEIVGYLMPSNAFISHSPYIIYFKDYPEKIEWEMHFPHIDMRMKEYPHWLLSVRTKRAVLPLDNKSMYL